MRKLIVPGVIFLLLATFLVSFFQWWGVKMFAGIFLSSLFILFAAQKKNITAVVVLSLILLAWIGFCGWQHYAETRPVSEETAKSDEKSEIARLKVELAQAKETKAREKWKLKWRLPPGKYEQDKNKLGLDVEVEESNSSVLRLRLYDTDVFGEREKVAWMSLRWVDGDLVGEWQNLKDGDGGNVNLYKGTPGFWSGQWEHKAQQPTHIELIKTYGESKPIATSAD